MLELDSYLNEPEPGSVDGVDIIIDVIGFHYFEEDNVSLCYRVSWSSSRHMAVWEPTSTLTNIMDGLLLWKIYMLTFFTGAFGIPYACIQNINSMPVMSLQWIPVIAVTRQIYHIHLGLMHMSMNMNTAQGRSYARYTANAHSPRLMEVATTTLSVGKHLIKIPTAGWLMDSCGALLPVMVCGRLKIGHATCVILCICLEIGQTTFCLMMTVMMNMVGKIRYDTFQHS